MGRRFEGKSVFITGASAGIGAALARAFAREGALVALAARRPERLAEVRSAIEQESGTAIAVVCDVCDHDSTERAVADTVEAFGGIDVAVANAGFGVSNAFDKLTVDDFRRQFETNVFGLLETIKAVLPHLKESKGRLALVSSVMGRVGAPATSPYCASKFAVTGLAESLYYELAEDGVSVTCIEPGLVESDFRMTDNQGQFDPGKKDPAPQWLMMSSGKAARHIVGVIYRRKPEAVITMHGKLGVFLCRHFPRSFRTLVRLMTRGRIDEVQRRKRPVSE